MSSRGQHLPQSPRQKRWWLTAFAAAAVVVGSVAGLTLSRGGAKATSQLSGKASSSGGAASTASTSDVQLSAQLAAAVTISPASGTTGVAPDAPVSVSSTSGRIQTVQVTDGSGTAVTGALAPTGQQWQSSGPLAPSTSYQVMVTVSGAGGLTARVPATFSTLTPVAKVTGSLYPEDAMTVGVGEPVVVHFSRSVRTAAAQAAVLSHLAVTSSVPVAGGWHWFSPTELHFRPQTYWPAGDHVTVSSNLSGWDAGNGDWGIGQVNVHFAIGDSHIAVADLSKDTMTVSDNGTVIANYPFSGGRTRYPTMTGIHLALDKSSVVTMDSATVGIPKGNPDYYYEKVYWDVRVSDSGEYVHAAPWSTGSQGRSNVSHGCINLTTDRAQTFFNFTQVGDVIQVINGPRPPVAGDHGVMDWSVDWSQWTPATAAPATAAPAVTAPTTAAPATAAPATA